MSIEMIEMPRIGESSVEGTLVKWLVEPGDKIKKYQPIAEIMTAKVTTEMPSMLSGVVQEQLIEEMETVAVGVAILAVQTVEKVAETKVASVEQKENIQPSEKVARLPEKGLSPSVRRLSKEHQIDLTQLDGTGIRGRITKKDVAQYIQNRKQAPQPQIIADQKIEVKKLVASDTQQVIQPSPIRLAIAKHMEESKSDIPHAWMMVEADVTPLVKRREQLKHHFLEENGVKLTYFPYFVKAVAMALKKVPLLNASWQNNQILQHHEINLSIAVGTDKALFTPVIMHADQKSVRDIAVEIQQIVQHIKAGNLHQVQMEGGTFTVNNTGAFGSILSKGIINAPQGGILQVESIVKRPVVIDDMIAIRSMVNLCLSFDHRLLDGVMAGEFLATLKETLLQTEA